MAMNIQKAENSPILEENLQGVISPEIELVEAEPTDVETTSVEEKPSDTTLPHHYSVDNLLKKVGHVDENEKVDSSEEEILMTIGVHCECGVSLDYFADEFDTLVTEYASQFAFGRHTSLSDTTFAPLSSLRSNLEDNSTDEDGDLEDEIDFEITVVIEKKYVEPFLRARNSFSEDYWQPPTVYYNGTSYNVESDSIIELFINTINQSTGTNADAIKLGFDHTKKFAELSPEEQVKLFDFIAVYFSKYLQTTTTPKLGDMIVGVDFLSSWKMYDSLDEMLRNAVTERNTSNGGRGRGSFSVYFDTVTKIHSDGRCASSNYSISHYAPVTPRVVDVVVLRESFTVLYDFLDYIEFPDLDEIFEDFIKDLEDMEGDGK